MPVRVQMSVAMVRVLVQGEPHYLVVRTGRLSGWSLIAATIAPPVTDWREAAAAACAEKLAPLQPGTDFDLASLTRKPLRWTSRSITGTETAYTAHVYSVRLARPADECLARLAVGTYRFVAEAQLDEARDAVLSAVVAALPDAPLSWPPAPAATTPVPPTEHAARSRTRAPRTRKDPSDPSNTPTGGAVATRVWSEDEDRLLGTMSDRDVAMVLGTTPAAVESRRVHLGVRGFTRWVVRKDLSQLAGAQYAADLRAGLTISEITRKHGVLHSTVLRSLERYRAREQREASEAKPDDTTAREPANRSSRR